MKRTITVLLCLALCSVIFASCGKNSPKVGNDNGKLKPTEAVDIEKLQPDDDFAGDFKNEGYTAHIEKDENGEMSVTIKSIPKDKVGYEWTMSGFFSDEYYRINYDNAVKSVIGYDEKGNEKDRTAEYENGAGRIAFSDADHFTWNNSMETTENNNEFIRQ